MEKILFKLLQMNRMLNLKRSPNDDRDYVFYRQLVKQSNTNYPEN